MRSEKRGVNVGCVLFIALFLIPWGAQALQSGDYTYTTNTVGEATITGYTGAGGDIIIPAVLDGHIVNVIGDDAFGDCDSLTSVTIPEGVGSIETFAFYNCNNLASLMISSSVTNIHSTMVDYSASLTNISVDVSNTNYSCVDGILFNKNQTILTVDDTPDNLLIMNSILEEI